jgi:hypothetical protein
MPIRRGGVRPLRIAAHYLDGADSSEIHEKRLLKVAGAALYGPSQWSISWR